MFFTSTRQNLNVTAAQAIAQGISKDGGLFVPSEFPQISREMLEKQSDDGHALEYHICGTKGAIETDVFRRRIRRWEFTDSPSTLESRIVETRTFSKEIS